MELSTMFYSSTLEADYRQVRQELLEAYITCTKALYPQALDIVGIATENDLEVEHRSEDAMYLDARGWTEEQLEDARRFQQETAFLTNITKHTGKEKEYPVEPERSEATMKGRDRNKPCICGSGRSLRSTVDARVF